MASVVHGEPFVDPDELKVPENPRHRRVIDVVAAMAGHLLGPEQTCYRDMNWYPPDGGNAVAPDIMVLSSDMLESGAKSYRQPDESMPSPSVVIEVPSDSDGWGTFQEKLYRYQHLGVMVYVISADNHPRGITRLGLDDEVPVPWTAGPIPELGNLIVDLEDGEIVAIAPEGEPRFASTEEIYTRHEALAARLRQLGEDPDAL